MKLTKIHIFLILLLALVLCSTLGMCSNQGLEGFSNRSDDKRSYNTYSDYNTQKNDDNIRSVNHSDNKSFLDLRSIDLFRKEANAVNPTKNKMVKLNQVGNLPSPSPFA